MWPTGRSDGTRNFHLGAVTQGVWRRRSSGVQGRIPGRDKVPQKLKRLDCANYQNLIISVHLTPLFLTSMFYGGGLSNVLRGA